MGRPDPPPRGRPATLSLDRIVAAAVEVADELSRTEGLDALSMRSIATRLGVGTMSLYRYVPGKSELLDLMLDHVVDFPEEAAQPDGRTWREILTADARYHWRLCLDHPGTRSWTRAAAPRPERPARPRPVPAPAAPVRAPDRTLMMMISTQVDYVEGVARRYINERRAEARTGVSNEQFWQAQEPTLAAALTSGDYPTMADLSEDTFDFSFEELFEFGLTRLHDGFARLLDEHPG